RDEGSVDGVGYDKTCAEGKSTTIMWRISTHDAARRIESARRSKLRQSLTRRSISSGYVIWSGWSEVWSNSQTKVRMRPNSRWLGRTDQSMNPNHMFL